MYKVDVVGRELNVGDIVATLSIGTHYKEMWLGRVVGFTPKLVKIQRLSLKDKQLSLYGGIDYQLYSSAHTLCIIDIKAAGLTFKENEPC